jgi:hypothetical protein
MAPYVPVQSNAGLPSGSVRHVVMGREDYEGEALGLRRDADGRPIMAIRTERADGSNDCHVFAPTATVTMEGN